MDIKQSPSPNFFSRSGNKPELIVIHNTEGNWDTDKEWLRNPVSLVSSHYIISPAGEVHQLVADSNGAWHAGRIDKPTAKLKKNQSGSYVNPNLYSIGIEVSLKSNATMPEVQKDSLLELIKLVASTHNISIDRDHIVGHHEIYSIKSCPGKISVDDLVEELGGPSIPLPVTNDNAKIKAQIIELVNKIK